MIAIKTTIEVGQRGQRHVHHLTVTAQVDAVFLQVESDRSRSGRIDQGLITDVRNFVVVLQQNIGIDLIQRDETHIIIEGHRLLGRIHQRRLALARLQLVLRGSSPAHLDALVGHEHILEINNRNVSHMRHVFIIAQGNRLRGLPIVVHANLRHLIRCIVGCIIAFVNLLTRNRIIKMIHAGRQG